MKTLTLKLPPLLYKGIKENAAEKGISMERYSIEALEIHNRTHNRKKLEKPFRERVFLCENPPWKSMPNGINF
uniref:hypothetical protein n=1 Tax=Algoriphagus sp. TaxID=1872435 RepID=UPI0040477B55